MDDEDCVKVLLCELLYNLYCDVGDYEEVGVWEVKFFDYVYWFFGMLMFEFYW